MQVMYRHIQFMSTYTYVFIPPNPQTNAVNCNYFIILYHKCSPFPHKTVSEHVGRTTTVYAILGCFFSTQMTITGLLTSWLFLLTFCHSGGGRIAEWWNKVHHQAVPCQPRTGHLLQRVRCLVLFFLWCWITCVGITCSRGEMFGSFFPVMLNHLCGYHLLQRVRCLVLFFL